MKKAIKWALVLSILSFVISIIGICVYCFKVKPYSIVTLDTFIAVIAAFIGISVTLVIGFQIYSVLSIKDKLSQIKSVEVDLIETKQELIRLKESLNETEIELKGKLSEAKARLNDDNGKYADAFKELNNAILYYCCLDSMKETLPVMVDLLNSYSKQISSNDFNKNNRDIFINSFLLLVQNDSFKIAKTKFFWVIKDKYQRIIKNTIALVESFKTNRL